MSRFAPALAALFAAGLALPAAAAPSADLKSAEGEPMGAVDFTETPNGLLVVARLQNVPEGVHGFHIHETGACEPDFKAAGGHLVGDAEAHGLKIDGGPHAGDLPNIHVPSTGELNVEFFARSLSMDELMDDDGSAVVIHSGADDYKSQPSGDAGERIGCGVVSR